MITLLCIFYSFNYILLRENGYYLYLGSFFSYDKNIFSLIMLYLAVIPFVAYVIYVSDKKIFSMLLSTLMIVGVLPGIPVYFFSGESSFKFIFLYVYVVFFLSLFSKPKLSLNNIGSAPGVKSEINVRVLSAFVSIGCLFFVYLIFKYQSIMNIRSFSDVYIQRTIFSNLVSTWEIYFIIFSKYIAAFSSLMLAVSFRKVKFLTPVFFIYITDYALAAHKTSLLLMVFAVIYYFKLSRIDFKKEYFPFIIKSIIVLSSVMSLSVILTWTNAPIIVSLYDRSFHVTTGLFARFHDFTQNNYFFFGGSGLLGNVFGGVDNGQFYTLLIGEEYFSKGVRANADIIADGYINFGLIGSLVALFILWSFFNKKDDKVFSENFKLLMPLTFIYSIVLFSMGLQTALVTGGMVFFILLIKFGFK
jgi:hypothetical protein